jgi:hypothetical protein
VRYYAGGGGGGTYLGAFASTGGRGGGGDGMGPEGAGNAAGYGANAIANFGGGGGGGFGNCCVAAGSGGSGTVISGPYGSFSMHPGDDILAAPNIRNATAGGGSDTSAIIAALQGMSFHVTNVFDGDKIQSSLSIRQGQTLNNINQV